MIGKKSEKYRLALLPVVLLLAACAATPQKPNPDDIAVRVQERWDKLATRDFAGAYAYLSPGYRSIVSLNDYMAQMLKQKVRWAGGRYVSSECTENACQVRVDIDYSLTSPVPGLSRYDGTQKNAPESWVRTEGQWWYLPEK